MDDPGFSTGAGCAGTCDHAVTGHSATTTTPATRRTTDLERLRSKGTLREVASKYRAYWSLAFAAGLRRGGRRWSKSSAAARSVGASDDAPETSSSSGRTSSARKGTESSTG